MKDEILIFIGAILILAYLLFPTPYCKNLQENDFPQNVTYNLEEVGEIKELEITLLKVKGNSMFPTIKEGDVCLCIKKEVYFEKDIVFFITKTNGNFTGVIHRIFSIEGNNVFTKGDNNNWIDPLVFKENIICGVPKVPRYLILK